LHLARQDGTVELLVVSNARAVRLNTELEVRRMGAKLRWALAVTRPVLVAGLLAGSAAVRPTAAQEEGTGTVIGRVVWCDLQSETTRPAVNALVVAEGTFIGTRTDDRGEFTLRDVPAGPDLVIEALSDDEQIKAMRPDVPVTADRTLDIGTLELGGSVLTGCSQTATDDA
jgi:hypothetical protein